MKERGMGPGKPNYFSEIFRSTGSGMLWLMILLVLGGLYLAVSAKTAQLGRDVIARTDEMRNKMLIRNERAAELAEITAPGRLKLFAESEGYREARQGDVVFAEFDEPPQSSEFVAPPPDNYFKDRNQILSPAYTETLIDGFRRWLGTEEIE